MKHSSSEISQLTTGYGTEFFIALKTPEGLTFQESILSLFRQYQKTIAELGLDQDSEVFIFFHLSDITNQLSFLHDFLATREHASFYSFLGQPPSDRSKFSALAYHIKAKNPISKTLVSKEILRVQHGQYNSLWLKSRPQHSGPSSTQTEEIFSDLSIQMKSFGALPEKNLLRTWLYVRDIDNNYLGMVKVRKSYFESVRLTENTHFVASTGIESCNDITSDIVHMDSLSVTGLTSDQQEYMCAPDHMCPTSKYGVTFERGTRVTYGDRSHYYISGTASINNQGEILYPGDVVKQTERTLENIHSLLSNYGAGLNHLQSIIVYLRDPSDYDRVKDVLKNSLAPKLPSPYLKAAVCRPGWLVEIEGIAISATGDKNFAPFM